MGSARKTKVEKQDEVTLAKWEKNYAVDSRISERALNRVSELIMLAKNNRKAKEQEWLEDLRNWSCSLSDTQMYNGRANLFVPELHNQIESTVGKIQAGLFPADDYIYCVPREGTTGEDAQNIQDAVFYELDYRNNLPVLMERYQRQKVLYGTSPLKGCFREEKKTIFAKNKNLRPEKKEIYTYRGVKWDLIDIFRFYVFPETVEDIDSADIIFDENFYSKRKLDRDEYVGIDDLSDVPSDWGDLSWVDTTRMQISNLTLASQQHKDSVILTECWLDFDIVEGVYVPCVITLGNYSKIVRIQRNPYWFQKAPYVVGRYLKPPAGEFYGRSLPERLRSPCYQMNDLANITMDSLNYSLSPIALIDPGYAGDIESFKQFPGAKWFASPQGVEFKNFPDVSQSGFAGMNQVRAMIAQFSDNTPPMAPQLAGKVRSATQAQAVQGELASQNRFMIRPDETDVLKPMCYMTHILLQQYQNEEYQVICQGPAQGSWITKNIKPADIVGGVEFMWKGSVEIQRTAVKNQQLIAFFDKAIQLSQIPDFQGKVDLIALYKEVSKQAFDMPLQDVFLEDKQKFTVSPDIENMALNGAREVPINDGDIYQEHMEEHMTGLLKASDEESRTAYLRHMEKHRIREQGKKMLQQQQMQIAQLQGEIQGNNMSQGPGGESPQGQVGGPQNPSQSMNPASESQVMQGLRGVEGATNV